MTQLCSAARLVPFWPLHYFKADVIKCVDTSFGKWSTSLKKNPTTLKIIKGRANSIGALGLFSEVLHAEQYFKSERFHCSINTHLRNIYIYISI